MGTGVSFRRDVLNGLGAMYGMLIFFDAWLKGSLADSDAGLSGGESSLLSGADEGVSNAVDSLRSLRQALDGDDLESFAKGLLASSKFIMDGLREVNQ